MGANRWQRVLVGIAASTLIVGCGSGSSPGDPDGGAGLDAGALDATVADPTAALFDPDHIVEIEIDIAPADWDEARNQARTADILFKEDCLAAPFGSPFTYFSAAVTIDGTVIENVGVRKKGFLGSLDNEKPSLKIKFDEFVPNQEFSGLKRMTLNNNKQDPTYIHQCLGYQLFADAGIPAPRCNFAHVTVNGNNLGLFAHVETVRKRFLARHFEDNQGRLYEGTLSDFRPTWKATFEPKTDRTNPDRSDIDALTAALEQPDENLVAALAPVTSVDRFLSFWATEVLIGHGDGYASNTNNFFIYTDPLTGLIEFMPWGIDNILVPSAGSPQSVYANGILAHRLYKIPGTQAQYLARMQELLDTIWDEAALIAEIDRMETLLAPVVADDPFLGARVFADEVETVRTFVQGRRAQIEAELAAPPIWDRDMRDSFCFFEIGTLQGTFATTFGTLEDDDAFAAGTGTLTGQVDGNDLVVQQVGSKAGTDPNNAGLVQIQMIAQVGDNLFWFIDMKASADQVTTGATVPLGFWSSYIFEIDTLTGKARTVGLIQNAVLELTQAGQNDTDPIEGSISGTILHVPF